MVYGIYNDLVTAAYGANLNQQTKSWGPHIAWVKLLDPNDGSIVTPSPRPENRCALYLGSIHCMNAKTLEHMCSTPKKHKRKMMEKTTAYIYYTSIYIYIIQIYIY